MAKRNRSSDGRFAPKLRMKDNRGNNLAKRKARRRALTAARAKADSD